MALCAPCASPEMMQQLLAVVQCQPMQSMTQLHQLQLLVKLRYD